MSTVLVTGASSFLGYHVVKRFNEQGVRPRVLELPGSALGPLNRLDVERAAGDLGNADAVATACAGVDSLLHLAFKVSVGGGQELLGEMERINVAGTERLLDAAAARGVSRAVVSGSALAVGANRTPAALDENASWSEHALDIPYALNRRKAEQAALSRARPGFAVSVVCPSFTLGPDDPVGAPANQLIKALINNKLPFTVPVGFGVLDVRDFADAVVRAAERGTSGQRYLISGHNVMTGELFAEAARAAGVRPPTLRAPMFVLRAAVGAVGLLSRIRGKAPPVEPSVLQLLTRYAWYDTTRARTDLGWEPRPLRQSVEDTVRSLREQAPSAPVASTG